MASPPLLERLDDPRSYHVGFAHRVRADDGSAILVLDEGEGRIGLKIGLKAPPFEDAFSIIPSGPIDTSTLRDAVYRYRRCIAWIARRMVGSPIE
jgi:hypothetical protein